MIKSTARREVGAVLERRDQADLMVGRRVKGIVEDVRKRGDEALLEYAKHLDGLEGSIEIGSREMRTAAKRVQKDVQRAIVVAATNLRAVATRQVPRTKRIRTVR